MNRRDIEVDKSRRLFPFFAKAVQPRLVFTDFHIKYYRVLHRFATGEIKKLIITVPPQHGKSEGSTRLLPAFMLGLNPDRKIAIASYSDRFAKRFNRDIQRIIDSPVYSELFTGTRLNGKNIVTVTTSALRNSSDFEIVGKLGSLKAVGRGGPLTGNQVDVMILDDLYSNSMEGNSPTVRESVWEWYTSVVKTRLHNDSQELIVFTRWHEDDLIGRLEEKEEVIKLESLDQIDPNFDGWYKLNFEAIKESAPTELDNREMGAALWPERHGLKLLNEKRALDNHSFNCMYQGHPASATGLLYSGFKTYSNIEDMGVCIGKGNYTDTADMGSDYLCSICYDKVRIGLDEKHQPLYALCVTDVLYTQDAMEKTAEQLPEMLDRTATRYANIESNNGGRAFALMVRPKTRAQVQWFTQSKNKESRILTNAPLVNQHIYMPDDWMQRWPVFAQHITKYLRNFVGNTYHDGPDVLTGIIEKDIQGNGMQTGVSRRN